MNENDLQLLLRELKKTLDYSKDGFLKASVNSLNLGMVIDLSKNKTVEDTILSFGSVKVLAPFLYSLGIEYVWAKPLRFGMGSLEIPKAGSTVAIIGIGEINTTGTDYYYMNLSPIDANPLRAYGGFQEYFNAEPAGFTYKTSNSFKGYIGGRFAKKTLENPSEARIVASTNKYIIYESDKDEELQIRAADNFNVKMHTGDGGNINIGYLHPENDTEQTGSANVKIDVGVAGDIDLNTIDGNVNVQTTTGYIKLTAGSNSIKVTPNGIYIVGDTYISGTTMISKEIHWQTTGFSPTGTPPYNTAVANKGSTHTHMTDGAPPTPGT